VQEHPASQEAYITGTCWRSFFSKGSYFGASVRERGKTFQLLSFSLYVNSLFFCPLGFWCGFFVSVLSCTRRICVRSEMKKKSPASINQVLFHAGFRHLHNTSVAYDELAWYLRWRKFPSCLWSSYNISKFSTFLLGFPGFPEGNLW